MLTPLARSSFCLNPSRSFPLWLVALALACSIPFVNAAQSGVFIYEDQGGWVEITGCDPSASGAVNIPATLGGVSVHRISHRAFADLPDVTSISVPAGVTAIGDRAFSGCDSLTSIIVEGSNVNYSSSSGVLFDKGRTQLIQFPGGKGGSYFIPSTVQQIGQQAFFGCGTMTYVSIPNSVSTIGDWAFSFCDGLTSVTIPRSVRSFGEGAFSECADLSTVTMTWGVTEIGPLGFWQCRALTSIAIPGSVTAIGEQAFFECSQLASIAIPSSVRSLAPYTFLQCESLSNVTLPATMSEIGEGAFCECEALSGINLPAGVTSIGPGAFAGCSALQSFVLPTGVTSIADNLFEECEDLASVTLHPNVLSIGESAFDDCSSLAAITLPGGLESIGESAFSECSALSAITIPANVTELGPFAFAFCGQLASIGVAAGNAHFESVGGVLFSQSGDVLVQYPCGRVGSYAVPDGTLEIEAGAFLGSPSLSAVTIPASVTRVGMAALALCEQLGAISVDVLNPNFMSVGGVLFNGAQAELLQYPGGKSGGFVVPPGAVRVGDFAFAGCADLTEVAFPDSLTSIGEEAFTACSALSELVIPDGVTGIGQGAFAACEGLIDIHLPSDITIIEEETFDGCIALESITIPDGVTTLGEGAFFACESLITVTIPAGVDSIGGQAFAECYSLETAVFLGDAPTLEGYGAFRDTHPAFTVLYLPGSDGFSSPVWDVGFDWYPAEELNAASDPQGAWLVSHGLAYGTDLHQDLNGDGVDLLLAYALNLDPDTACGELPPATLTSGALGMEFWGDAPDISYTVQTSTDMQSWVTTGVTLSSPDPEGLRTATVDRDGPRRFLRLMVED